MAEVNYEEGKVEVGKDLASTVSAGLGRASIIEEVPKWARVEGSNASAVGGSSEYAQAGRNVPLPGKAVLDGQGNVRREAPDGTVGGIVLNSSAVTDETRARLTEPNE